MVRPWLSGPYRDQKVIEVSCGGAVLLYLQCFLQLRPAGKDFFFFTFVLSENVFVLALFLKNIFAAYRILGWFFFITLKVLLFFLLAFTVSDVNHIWNFSPSVYKGLFFSDCFYYFLVTFSFQWFDSDISRVLFSALLGFAELLESLNICLSLKLMET